MAFSIFAFAKDERKILKCLGQEEKRLHLSKDLGPTYDLNQRLMAEMIQIPQADLGLQDLQEICHPGNQSESLKLLQLSLQKGKSLFSVPSQLPSMQKDMAQGMIDDYVEITKDIFLNFISQIQTIAPSPKCLEQEIPELHAFFIDIKYLQEDVDIKAIFKGRENTIFEQLKGYSEAFKRCQARLKKNTKSGSTDSDKKR